MRTLLPLILLVCCPLARGADGVLVVTKAGYYLLVQDAAGVPTLTTLADLVPPVTIKQVLKLDSVSPSPPPTPDPTDRLTVHKKTVQAATDKVTDPNKANVKIALGKLYRMVAGLPVTGREQLLTSTDLLFNSLALPPVWMTWKQEVHLSAVSFVSLEDARKAWNAIADVLEGK